MDRCPVCNHRLAPCDDKVPVALVGEVHEWCLEYRLDEMTSLAPPMSISRDTPSGL
jgi:hypothetical protein